tara:strand:- start:3752 stop:6310 length:2559 start_codon:yes stop_codon:yes gene_type:complete
MNNQNENLIAILGPTNTGKTYMAFEKLLSYSSGIFGFPLRLLARENYDKAVKKLGINNVALITGEEKIIPREAKYYFCTVESMPINLVVDCVIIDEVQLAADYERGHIFTDRILNLRGNFETIFLGSSTMTNILIELFPNIIIKELERFSKLSFISNHNLSKLKPRSAIIAFNINKIYEIAESIRTHKGGAAVVLGSLSPRTRNAQVEIYENKKVDYLIATDAIGMGLNLSINNICFTSLEKFDGKYNRNLLPSEIGQIAGRAGRYKNDGTFSYTKGAGILDPIIIKSIENHSYNKIQKIYWRNSNIDFSSINSVLNSLKQFPIQNFFIHKKNAIDELNFRTLIDEIQIKNYLNNKENIKLLWDICRIPDFEKIFNDNYLTFLKNFFLVLVKNNNKIPEDWLSKRIIKLDNFIGDIPELSLKISQIRTWTYISNHHEWLENPNYWQERTLQIENDLSDNLHVGLTKKFIDASSKYFIGSSNQDTFDKIEINKKNEIILDNKKYGKINGFDLLPNKKLFSPSLFLFNHVKKSARKMIEEKIETFLNAPNDSISIGDPSKLRFNETVKIYWGDEAVGKLIKGSKIYSPLAEATNSEFLSSEKKLLVSAKLQNWIDNEIAIYLKPIKDDLEDNLNSQVRAIAFNCFENLGTYPIDEFKIFLNKIDNDSKLQLSKLGIRIGAKYFFTPNFLKKKQLELSSLLWKIYFPFDSHDYLPLPKDGRVSFICNIPIPKNYWQYIGYICINKFAFRVDVFEKIFYLARQKIKKGPFLESSELMNPMGCNSNQLKDILTYCGYDFINICDDKKLFYYRSRKKENIITAKKNKKNYKSTQKQKNYKPKVKQDPNSPFAVLEKLL